MSQDIINNRFLEESVFAIADGYCVINLTKSIVRGSMYQVVNGKKYNLNEQLGLPENSSLQSLVDAWALTIPEEGLQNFITVSDYTEAVDGITTYEWTITDTGIGMSKEYQKHILSRFRRKERMQEVHSRELDWEWRL